MATVSHFAAEIERDEQRIYRELAKLSKRTGIRRIFRGMVDDEKVIINNIAQLCQTGTESACVNSDTLVRPKHLLLDQIQPEEELKNIENDVDAYRFIMKLEGEIAQVYEKAAHKTRNRQVRQALREVLDIKQREMREMENVLLFADAPNQYLEWGEFSNPEQFCNFGRCVDQ